MARNTKLDEVVEIALSSMLDIRPHRISLAFAALANSGLRFVVSNPLVEFCVRDVIALPFRTMLAARR